ncbi:MAG TPA: helix-turn-helix domain-containing protein [Solirubrobacterales bacterium]|nr:helix-turn-helix domain-containing protein [Solirubrobacterales bacterium]
MGATDRTEETDLLRALRHPLRRRILREMADGSEVSPRGLSNLLRQPLSNVSYHVRVLAECRAINLVGTRPARGSVQHFYRSTVEAPWALQVLGPGESERSGTGEKPDGAPN